MKLYKVTKSIRYVNCPIFNMVPWNRSVEYSCQVSSYKLFAGLRWQFQLNINVCRNYVCPQLQFQWPNSCVYHLSITSVTTVVGPVIANGFLYGAVIAEWYIRRSSYYGWFSRESNHCGLIHNREQSLGGDSFEGVVIVGCFIRLPYRKFNSLFMFVMYKIGNLGIYKYVLELLLLKFISIGN